MKEQSLPFRQLTSNESKHQDITIKTTTAGTLPVLHAGLKQKLRSLCAISDEAFHKIEQSFQILDLTDRQVLISTDQVPDRIFYIQKGLLRGYYIDNNQPVTSWFAGEDEFIMPNNYFRQERSNEYIQSLESCSLLALSYQACLKISQESDDMMKIFLHLLEEKQDNTNVRERMLSIPNAEKRYRSVLGLMPGLQHSIKDELLASYLNISRRHLERLKIKTFKDL